MSIITMPIRRGRDARPLLVVLAAVTVAVGSHLAPAPAAPRPDGPVRVAAPDGASLAVSPLAEIDRSLAAWSANLAAEPNDFISAIHLGELSLARLRLSADPADARRARAAADRALEAHPGLLAGLLLRAQAAHAAHDFAAAEADASAVLRLEPDAPEALAVLADAQLELGAYEASRATLSRLVSVAAGPAVDARRARRAALTGDLAEARTLASVARAAAELDPAGSPTTVSWYHVLESALAFQAGAIGDAEAAARAALEAWPGSAVARYALARALAARGELDAAAAELEAVVAMQPLPDALLLLAGLHERAGDTEAAAAAADALRALGSLGSADRQLARYLADRGEDPARAVGLARRDLERRADVHAHDTLAWALLAAGDAHGADAAMALARAAGTEDAMLDYHAGMIAAALGREGEARALLLGALERNPGFDPIGAERARQTLRELGS